MATDQVDGWLARRRNQTSAFGSLLDPIADKVLVLAALVMLVAEGVAPAWMVAAIVAREIAVSGLRLAAIERGVVMGARDLGKLKTWAQTVAATLAGLQAAGAWDADVAWWALLVATLLTWISGLDYARVAPRVLRGERTSLRSGRERWADGARPSVSSRPRAPPRRREPLRIHRDGDRPRHGRPLCRLRLGYELDLHEAHPTRVEREEPRGRRLERRDDGVALAEREPRRRSLP